MFYKQRTAAILTSLPGVAYQLTPHDPLVDTNQCTLDANLMKELGANAIRVYHVDTDVDHTGCMKAFADAGIYLFVDLDDFDSMILPDTPHWNQTQLESFQAVMDEFHTFDNTAGFFVGNEVLTTANNSGAAPYVLAAARDLKKYRDEKKYRNIPVGYSAADIAQLRPMLQNYFECRSDPYERLDFFSLNAYEWCGSSTSFRVSGYSTLQDQAKGYPVPIFFSETGCNTVKPRTFGDQSAIFGPDMEDTWSGSIIYEWLEEANDYGLISYGPQVAATATDANVMDGFSRAGTPTPVAPDFANLQSQWATLTPTGTPLSLYTASSSPLPACPSSTSGAWEVNPSAALPSVGQSGTSAPASATPTGASATSGKAGSASASAGAGVKTVVNPASYLGNGQGLFSGAVAGLMVLGGFFVYWL